MRLFSDAAEDISDPLMCRAYALAELGRGTTSPNPVVGCVIARDGAVVGEGFHEFAGGPHAEIVAMSAAGEAARGATAYVTLEPCDHQGRTPPCTEALLAAGIARVSIGMRDPNPGVSGGGAAKLAAEGVEVVFADDPAPFAEQNEAWLHSVTEGTPWVQVKVALSLDGRPAARAGRRLAITGPEALSLTMRLRTAADAILVGAGTVSADDPLLTVRDDEGRPAERQPMRVVLCRSNVPSPAAAVFAADQQAVVLASDVADENALDVIARRGVRVLRYSLQDGLAGALSVLDENGVVRILAETGPALFGAMWREGVIDELVTYYAGGVIGEQGLPLFDGDGRIEDDRLAREFEAREVGMMGPDVVVAWRPRARGAA